MFGHDFFLIAGPCVLEDDTLNLRIGEALAELSLKLPVVYKASFDKANRSKPGAPRGPGLREGLRQLERVRAATGLPLLTDVHEPAQCLPVAAVCDVLQIPAFLCRQTDLITAAALTGCAVNIKKGQWMAPAEMAGAVGKARRAGATEVAVTERGTAFGYGNLVVDMRAFAALRHATEATVVFDATHSSCGARHVEPLALAAVAAGADALYLETHPEPTCAPSDGQSMLPLARLGALMERVLDVRAAVRGSRA
jgi:2-dehydro-3-deoxyphosphooctonate aldolase (KDO 8-P synthase)